MLQAHGITATRGGRPILTGIDLALPAGQVTGVLGANGAGKSTLLAVLAGELPASTGSVTLHGRPLSAWPAAELARCRAVLPQSPSLQFDLPVATVIGMGAYPHARRVRTRADVSAVPSAGPVSAGLASVGGAAAPEARGAGAAPADALPAGAGAARSGCSAEAAGGGLVDAARAAIAEDRRILQRVLALADAQDLYARRYRRLSGGEQQRVHLARVLYQLLLARQGRDEYRVLMLDEPTASLDPRHQLHLLSTVRTLAHEEHVAALVILHDLNLAAGCCDQLLLISQGRAAAHGTPAQVLTPDTLRQVYGVSATVLPHPHQPGRPLVVF